MKFKNITHLYSNPMKLFHTERLEIHYANLNDGPFIFELLNSPTWIKYIGNRNINSIADAENYIKNALINSYQEKGYGLFKVVLKSNNTPIGLCGFLKRDYLPAVDIGYALLPDYEGQGLAFEAAQGALNYGINTLGFEAIFAITSPDNGRSQKLLTKLGFSKTRDTRKHESEILLVYALIFNN